MRGDPTPRTEAQPNLSSNPRPRERNLVTVSSTKSSPPRCPIKMPEMPNNIQRFEDMPPDIQQATLSFAQYAMAMQGAQLLEFKLAVLWNLIETDLTRRQEKNIGKAFRPIAKRVRHSFQRATASELRKNLEGKVEDELLEQVSDLIKVRDRLAHRYLQEQYVLPPPAFGHRMFTELQAIIEAFNAVNALVDEKTDRVAKAKLPDGEDWLPGIEQLTRNLMYGDLE